MSVCTCASCYFLAEPHFFTYAVNNYTSAVCQKIKSRQYGASQKRLEHIHTQNIHSLYVYTQII